MPIIILLQFWPTKDCSSVWHV